MQNAQYFGYLCIFVLQFHWKAHAEAAQPSQHDNLLQLTQGSLEGCFEDAANAVPVEITEVGFEALLRGTRDPPRNAKCLRYCIMRKNKLFDAEDHLDVAEMFSFFAKLFSETVPEKLLQSVIEKCQLEANTAVDRCERAHLAAMCILYNLNENGVENI